MRPRHSFSSAFSGSPARFFSAAPREISARTFPMVSPRLAEITLDRERGHAVVAAEFEHEESPRDYVPPELIERRERPR